MRKFLHNQKGSVMVIVAMAMVVFMGMAALTIDLSTSYVTKSNLQKAADAAAMAGAEMLPNTSSALSTAISYAGSNGMNTSGQTSITNGIQSAEVTITTPYNGDSTKVQVVCTRTVNYIFARVLGINTGTVTATAVAQQTAGTPGGPFNYSLFSGSNSVPLKFSGSNVNITGSAHTNNSLSVSGINLKISGASEASSSINISGSITNIGTAQAAAINESGSIDTFGTKILSAAPNIAMPDLSSTIQAQAAAAGQAYTGDKTYSANNFTINGPTYVNGNVTISGSNFSGTGCILATGNITITGSNLTDSSSDAICFYSQNGNVTFSGSNINLQNIIVYAPNSTNGNITFSGANATILGRVIGNTVTTSGCNLSITGGTKEFNSLPSTGGGTKLIQ